VCLVRRLGPLKHFAADPSAPDRKRQELLPTFSHFGIALTLISKWDNGTVFYCGTNQATWVGMHVDGQPSLN
jgi:hypothetical protein